KLVHESEPHFRPPFRPLYPRFGSARARPRDDGVRAAAATNAAATAEEETSGQLELRAVRGARRLEPPHRGWRDAQREYVGRGRHTESEGAGGLRGGPLRRVGRRLQARDRVEAHRREVLLLSRRRIRNGGAQQG